MVETRYMPAVRDSQNAVANLQAARREVGTGEAGGGTFVRRNDDNTGYVYGQDRAPLIDGQFVVPLAGFLHGYVDMSADNKMLERNMVSMVQQPTPPVPTKPWGTYEDGGPRRVTEILLCSIDERGWSGTYTAWGVSDENRIGNLLDNVVNQAGTPDGLAGFVNPVIRLKVGKYDSKKWKKTIYHFDYVLEDWLHNDGERLLSKQGEHIEANPAANDGPAPWEEELAGMSQAERDVMGT